MLKNNIGGKAFLKTSVRIGVTLAAMALLVALGLALLFLSFRQIEATSGLRKESSISLKSANELLIALLVAETNTRGYLLTGDPGFLEPYTKARASIGDSIGMLRNLDELGKTRFRVELLLSLVDEKMQYFETNIGLADENDKPAIIANINSFRGKALMDSIQSELAVGIRDEENVLARYEDAFQTKMRQMFVSIALTTIFTLLFALLFAWLLLREMMQRLKSTVYLETKHLLDIQEDTNVRLLRANFTLQESEEKLSVTLSSIGDDVLTTDAEGRVTGLNRVAEKLVGWSHEDAAGRPVDEIFHIVNQETRALATIPVMETLAQGTVQGLANHTVLIARDGTECAIADSCAPIFDRESKVIGAVLVFRDVTAEYAARQALHDSNALVQTILKTVVDGIITIRACGGIIVTANPAAEAMFACTVADIEGKSFSTLIPELDSDLWNGSLEYYKESDEARAAGMGREVLGRRADGSLFPMEIALGEMVLNGERYFTGILRDTTNRKATEAALLKAGALQNAIFDSANFSSIATDANGVIQIFNVGAERMLGYSAVDVLDKITPAEISDSAEIVERAQSLSAELGTTIAPGFEALIFKASRGIEDIYELTYIRKDGSRFPAVVSVTALRDVQSAIIGYLLIGTDNTARKRIEAERSSLGQALLDKNVELEHAKLAAEKANLAKSNFLSSMSHELRTPLSAVLGFAQLLESGIPQPTAAQKRSIDQILKAGWYLLKLINEILDLALIESGRLSLSIEPVAMIEVMYECETMIEPQAKKRGISVAFTQFPVPYYVKGDRTRVKQVILNLLSNAIKYNRVGGTVHVECSTSSTDTFRISVRDTGDGLDPEQLAQLFQPFNRLGQEAKLEEGTGIGLMVCKRLVELMGGVIGVDSTVGKGSVFWFELKLSIKPRFVERKEVTFSTELPQEILRSEKYTLLYVEDNPANLMLVEDLVARRPGIRLLSAQDGNQGLLIARSTIPDVILMDINLPGMSGLQALEILLEDPKTAGIPVIALSANAIPHDIEKGLAAGFFRYLTKPLKVDEFMATLDEVFEIVKKKALIANERDQS